MRFYEPIRVVQYGLGPIGLGCVRAMLQKQPSDSIELVGAIDIDPEKAGRTVGDLAGVPCDVEVSDDAKFTLHDLEPDVVLHTTSSSLKKVQDQLIQCMLADANVVSSTEELFNPIEDNRLIARELDSMARNFGVTVYGTGVNPGYAMDSLALMATGVCTRVDKIRVIRRVDAAKRRLPLQKKIGAGLTRSDFLALREVDLVGHAGLRESCHLVARGLFLDADSVTETLEPVLATRNLETPDLKIKMGRVAGIHQTARLTHLNKELVSLDLYMYVGAENPVDLIIVEGDPPIHMEIKGGIFGDTATVGALINAIPLVLTGEPGLLSPLEMPIPRCFLPEREVRTGRDFPSSLN